MSNRSERTPELRQRISKALQGHAVSSDTRAKISKTLIGQQYSPERCANIAAAFTPERRAKLSTNTYDGGAIAEQFAAVLLPAGFIREHHVWFGNKIDSIGRKSGHCRMDFAHVEGKVDIELDGSNHYRRTQSIRDSERDLFLRSLGWKVIRIKIAGGL